MVKFWNDKIRNRTAKIAAMPFNKSFSLLKMLYDIALIR